MAKTLQLTIPNACHEDWHAMSPVEKGRYCMSCRKNVTDFTNMSDREILQHITRSPGGVCGRLHNDQLNRTMTLQKERKLPWLKYFFRFALPAFFVSPKAEAQDRKMPVVEQTYRQKQLQKLNVEIPVAVDNKDVWAIRGRVLAEDNTPIYGASVIVKGTTKGAVTDAGGYYKFEFTDDKDVVLQISCIGYLALEMPAKPVREWQEIGINLTPLTINPDQVVTVGLIFYKPAPPKRSALEIARSIIRPDSVRIFPNPVGQGNKIDMELTVKEPGDFYVEVTDYSGRLMIEKEINANAKFFKSFVDTKQLLTGSYIVCVRNREGKKIGVKKIIVQ